MTVARTGPDRARQVEITDDGRVARVQCGDDYDLLGQSSGSYFVNDASDGSVSDGRCRAVVPSISRPM